MFGVATSTLDAAGDVARPRADADRRATEVEARRAAFVGEIEQVPPMVSAVKVGGAPAPRARARRAIEVDRAPRRVRVDRFDVEAFEPGPYPTATVLVECGSGTYIRSLAADLGERARRRRAPRDRCAGCGSARSPSTRRTRSTRSRPIPRRVVLAPVEAVRDLERVDVDAEQARAIAHGVTFPARVLLGEDRRPGRSRSSLPTASCSRCTSGAARALKPAVVLAPVEAS